MNEESFLPRIFACDNLSGPACPESGNIQNEFGGRIEPLEIKQGDEYPDAGDLGKIMIEISKGYCQNCANSSTKKGLLG
jgi:hypothetical protein